MVFPTILILLSHIFRVFDFQFIMLLVYYTPSILHSQYTTHSRYYNLSVQYSQGTRVVGLSVPTFPGSHNLRVLQFQCPIFSGSPTFQALIFPEADVRIILYPKDPFHNPIFSLLYFHASIFLRSHLSSVLFPSMVLHKRPYFLNRVYHFVYCM